MKTILIALLFSQSLFSQTIKDVVFNNVIKLDNDNTVTDRNDYLIDDVLILDKNKSLVIYNESNIPNSLFFEQGFVDRIGNFILIANCKNEKTPPGIICQEFVPCKTFYSIRRNNDNQILIDSLNIAETSPGKIPQLNFRPPFKETKDVFKVYYIDSWGSVCCPKDVKWDFEEKITAFRKEKLAVFKDRIADTYTKNMGEEGEYLVGYPLRQLSKEERLEFIQTMISSVLSFTDKKNIYHSRLFYPVLSNNLE